MTTSSKDAKAVRLVDGQPLVPTEAQGQGAVGVVAAALRKLASLKREPARVIYQRASDNTEADHR